MCCGVTPKAAAWGAAQLGAVHVTAPKQRRAAKGGTCQDKR